MNDEPRMCSFKLPLPVREGLTAIARHHARFLRGHGRTGEPNRTWAIGFLVGRELKRIARAARKEEP